MKFALIFNFLLIVFPAFTTNVNIKKIDSLQIVLDNAKTLDQDKGNLYTQIAIEYKLQNDYEKAIENFKYGQHFYSIINDSINLGKTYESIGDIYFIVNDYNNSILNYQEAYFIYKNLKSNELIANLSISFADIFLSFGEYDKAYFYLNQAHNFYENHTNIYNQGLFNTYLMLGTTFGYKNVSDSALYYSQRALSLCDIKNDFIMYGGLLNNLGAIFSKMNKLDSAIFYYNKALALFKEDKFEKGVAITLSNIAFIYQKQNKLEDAISTNLNAIDVFKKFNETTYLKHAYLNLSDIYKEKSLYKLSYEYLQMYNSLNDSIAQITELSKLNNLELQYKIRKRDIDVETLQYSNDLIQKDNIIKQRTQYILIGGIILLILISFLILRNLRISLKNTVLKKKLMKEEMDKLEKEVDYQNKELENFAFRIVEKNDFLEKLKIQINEISEQKGESNLKEITNSVDNNLFIDKDLKEFELKAEEIQSKFFLKLNFKYPDLTKTDKRLCSLIVMGIGTKEAATILNISPDGVKKARYRLRKKFELESETDLTGFLRNL